MSGDSLNVTSNEFAGGAFVPPLHSTVILSAFAQSPVSQHGTLVQGNVHDVLGQKFADCKLPGTEMVFELPDIPAAASSKPVASPEVSPCPEPPTQTVSSQLFIKVRFLVVLTGGGGGASGTWQIWDASHVENVHASSNVSAHDPVVPIGQQYWPSAQPLHIVASFPVQSGTLAGSVHSSATLQTWEASQVVLLQASSAVAAHPP